MTRPLARLLFVLTLAVLGLGGPARAEGLTDVVARAAFVFNFSKYVEWDDEGPGEALLCIVTGDEAQVQAFARLQGRKIQGRTIKVVQLARPAEDMACRQLFVGRGTDRRTAESHLAAVRGRPVLTLGDIAGFLDIGGMVELVPRDERLTFQLSLGAIRRSGLRVSASALRLASEAREQ